MASKFGKILTFTALVSAATAGVLYYLHTRSEQAFDDFDDFDEDFDTDTSEETSSREYVPLDLTSEAAKGACADSPAADVETKVDETLRDAANEAASSVKAAAKETASNVKDAAKDMASNVKDAAKETASDMKDVLSEAEVFRFEDKKNR